MGGVRAAKAAHPPPPATITAGVTARQLEMIRSPARILYIGAGTKTGKTVALLFWVAEGILAGEATAWCGYVIGKSRRAYEMLKDYLKAPHEAGLVQFNDTRMRITSTNGGSFTAFTGENPEAIYGDGYDRFVIDEASRQTSASYIAALTTVSATKGKIRLAFNLDHGAKNWAIQRLVQTKNRTAEQRAKDGEDFMMFPTLAEAWVSKEDVDILRRQMPEAMAKALYDAIIPDEEATLFHNLDEIFSGPGVRGPDIGHTYIMGVDLARKQNWTVATVMDVTMNRLVAAERFNQISWVLQYEKLADLYQRWRVCRAWVDQSGLGDPVVAELEERGMAVEGVVFTGPIRKALVENLVVACDGMHFRASGEDQFKRHHHELEQFGYVLKADGKVDYQVAEGMNDDAAFSLALAVHGWKQGNFGPPIIRRPGISERPWTPKRIVGF